MARSVIHWTKLLHWPARLPRAATLRSRRRPPHVLDSAPGRSRRHAGGRPTPPGVVWFRQHPLSQQEGPLPMSTKRLTRTLALTAFALAVSAAIAGAARHDQLPTLSDMSPAGMFASIHNGADPR